MRWRYQLDRWRDALTASFRDEPSGPRPKICPACRTLVGATATRCHECGASLTFSLAAVSRSVSGLLPASAPATYCIVGLNLLLFGVTLLATARAAGGLDLLGGINSQILRRLGASMPLAYTIVEPWRLVTAIFLHGGILHIAMNSWVMMDIGRNVEEIYGSARYFFIYVVAGVVGFALSSFGSHFSVGASGSLMGLIGVMLAVTRRRGGTHMQMIRTQLIRWLAYMLLFGLMVPGIDNLAHIGGLGAGMLLGRVINDREPVTPEERRRAQLMGWTSGLAVVGSFALMMVRGGG
jgi:rhomboid protease GluP